MLKGLLCKIFQLLAIFMLHLLDRFIEAFVRVAIKNTVFMTDTASLPLLAMITGNSTIWYFYK